MSTDNYEFFKSNQPQGLDKETPFVNSQWNWINDINFSTYQNSSGLTLAQYDLSSLYNSTKLLQFDCAYIAVPITYCTAWASTSAILTPTSNAWSSTGLKSGYWNLVHACEISCNGQTVEQYQPYINQYTNVRLLSSFSQDDLSSFGQFLGMGDFGIDTYQSQQYYGGTNVASSAGAFPSCTVSAGQGNGQANNKPFGNSLFSAVASTTSSAGSTDSTTISVTSGTNIAIGQLIVGSGIPSNTYVVNVSGTTVTSNQKVTIVTATTLYFYNQSQASNSGEQSEVGPQASGTYNKNYASRLRKFYDTNTNISNFIGGSSTNNLTSTSNLAFEFKPYFSIQGTTAVWYDVGIIRLADLFQFVNQIPMSSKLDMTLRVYYNMGTVVSNINANSGLMLTSGAGISFTNTCPLIQSCQSSAPSGAVTMASAIFIGSPTTTSVAMGCTAGSYNFASGVAQHFLSSTRIYFKQVELKPSLLETYKVQNTNKLLLYTSILTNTFANISKASSFSFLVQSGVSRIKGIWIIPQLSASTNGIPASNGTAGILPFSQALSPFDAFPASMLSLINLQVSIASVNQLQNIYSYSFQTFYEQILPYANTSGSDLGLSVGLISSTWWDYNRVYYVDCTRGYTTDQLSPRNINISGTNNSNVTIDLLVFTEYYQERRINVITGQVSQ